MDPQGQVPWAEVWRVDDNAFANKRLGKAGRVWMGLDMGREKKSAAGYCVWDENLPVSTYGQSFLLQLGAKVIMTQ